MSQNVLMITHTFPPVGGGGVIRITKFAKYLPQFGWEPVILTADLRLSVRDESLAREVSSVRVVRTRVSLPQRARGWLIQKVLSRPQSSSAICTPVSVAKKRFWVSWVTRTTYFLYRLESAVLGTLLIPDQQITWVPAAFFAAQRILKKERISEIGRAHV